MLGRLFSILCIVGTLLLISACGNSGNAPAASGGTLKVGLLVTGSTSDGGWNQLAGESLAPLVKDQTNEIKILQQVPADKAADAIRQFESNGYNLVIAHGYEYQDIVKEITDPAKPNAVKMKIAVSGGDADSPNFQSLFYDLAPASYQLGIIAAKVSKTGKLGFVGGATYPTVTAMKRGFEAGAKSVNPNITVAEQYTGWDDPSKAKAQVEAFIQQGIDVVMQNVDAASSGVFEAVEAWNTAPQAGERLVENVYTFGANSDQNANATASDWILASAVIKMDKAFAEVAGQVKSNTFKGGLVKEDVANGIAVAVLNPKLIGKVIDADTQKLVDDATKGLSSGTIKIPEK